ncbi:kinase-like protein [Coniophora puteana RWD-64-598 SS2]|uniref:Kinase-like protein n=1 Tax=Coniophora puteana (strain RWD-64-598) TaxID=741705 RepID=A0A5M3MSD9_CONPW|nr:kinase-like protein [Coniophora puteana RWD-64-598 SS2]EIW81664.1 kinase-like protein [Coniophora puteana RWD-64-598 SS2]
MNQAQITDITSQVTKLEVHQRGGGSSGDVFYGEWRSSQGQTKVAIKTVRVCTDDPAEIANILQKFMREARVWATLKHEHIVPFCGIASDLAPRRGIPSVISPWYDSGSLRTYYNQHWQDGNGVAVNTRKSIMFGVLDGLKYLHTRDPPVVHGDLSTQNVLIDDKGQPRLTDFGLSVLVDIPGFTTVTNRGTYKYMAVELFGDGPGGPGTVPKKTKESDIWAFGILSLEILSNLEPYVAPSGQSLKDAVVITNVPKGHRPDHDRFRQYVDDDLWAMCKSCLRTDPRNRFTAEDISRNLAGKC